MASGVVRTDTFRNSDSKNPTPNPIIAPKLVDFSSSRTYATDLVKNLDIQTVSNPGYICQQKFSQCGHLKSPQERQQCESFWNDVCQKDKI